MDGGSSLIFALLKFTAPVFSALARCSLIVALPPAPAVTCEANMISPHFLNLHSFTFLFGAGARLPSGRCRELSLPIALLLVSFASPPRSPQFFCPTCPVLSIVRLISLLLRNTLPSSLTHTLVPCISTIAGIVTLNLKAKLRLCLFIHVREFSVNKRRDQNVCVWGSVEKASKFLFEF